MDEQRYPLAYREIIISALIAAVVETIVSTLLNWLTPLNFPLILLSALPAAILAFLGMLQLQKQRIVLRGLSATFGRADQSASEDTQLDQETISILKEMGLVDAVPILSDSRYAPLSCMEYTQRRLYFMGILGSKWVMLPHVRAQFEAFVKRVETRGGRIRFLLIDPETNAFQRLKDYRGGTISTEPLSHWKQLCQQSSCLEVRLYAQLPCFRLVFVDDHVLAMSRYKTDKEAYFESKYGWEAPHLVFDAEASWSLYDAFELHFQELWHTSRDISTWSESGTSDLMNHDPD